LIGNSDHGIWQPDGTPVRRHTLFVVVGLLPRPGIWDLDPESVEFMPEEAESSARCLGWLPALQLVLIGDRQREVSVSHGANKLRALDRWDQPQQIPGLRELRPGYPDSACE
jgi:hypothetical protein